jgi:hypothetical protein
LKLFRQALLMIMALLLIIQPINSSAVTQQLSIEWKVGSGSVHPGETIDIPVSFNKLSTGMASYGIKVDFDKSSFEVLSVTPLHGESFDNDCFSTTSGCIETNFNNIEGWVSVGWFDTSGENITVQTRDLFVIKFKAKESASLGDSNISINLNETSATDEFFTNLTQIATNGKIAIVEKIVQANAPNVTNATTEEDTQSVNGLEITNNSSTVLATHYKISDITGGQLYLNDGTMPIQNGQYIPAIEAEKGLKFTPAPNANTLAGDTFSFKVQASLDNLGKGLSEASIATITVNEVNDVPIAEDDVISSIHEGTGELILPFASLLSNDQIGPMNEAGQSLMITNVSNSVGGTVRIEGSNVLYVAQPGYIGPGSFEYTIIDNGTTSGMPDSKSDMAIVSFNIEPNLNVLKKMKIANQTVQAGTTIEVPVQFTGDGKDVAFQFDVQYDPSKLTLSNVKNSTITNSKLSIGYHQQVNGSYRILAGNSNNTAIENGEVAVIEFLVTEDIAGGTELNISLTNIGASDGLGKESPIPNKDAKLIVAKRSNADLSVLDLTEGTLNPQFDKDVLSYEANVSHLVNSLIVTPTVADKWAMVTVNGNISTAGTIQLATGENTITIVVTAEDGVTTKTYTVTVTKAEPPKSTNADLSGLTLSEGTLSPDFKSDVYSYVSNVSHLVDRVFVNPIVADQKANVTVNGKSANEAIDLATGENIITISVTAEDLVTNKTYTVTVTKAAPPKSSNADLSQLTLSPGIILTEVFDKDLLQYTANVNVQKQVTILAIPADSKSTMTYKLNDVDANNIMDLQVGNNKVEILVTAEDGTQKSYKLTITVGIKGDADLDGDVDINDWQEVAQFILNKKTPTPQALWNADMNEDNQISLGDWVLIANRLID